MAMYSAEGCCTYTTMALTSITEVWSVWFLNAVFSMKNLLLKTAIFVMLRILFYQTSQIDLTL